MLVDDQAPPVDRPNLSKDYLAGKAQEDWIPLRGQSFYSKNDIDLRLETSAAGVDLQVPVTWCSRMEARSPTTGCCSRREPSPFA